MHIFETPVYCGRLKEWRVLNMLSGTVYSVGYDSFDEAFGSIVEGEERCGMTVKRLELSDIVTVLNRADDL